LKSLAAAGVRFVVAGSVATMLHGGQHMPGDLDIVPDIAPDSLARLASVLKDIEATVSQVDRVSTWGRTVEGEWKCHQREATPEERQALLNWAPTPEDPGSFDHLLHTRFGNLDVVPTIAGTFSELKPRACVIQHGGTTVLVAHVADLLATLTVPRRAKDKERVRFLRNLQMQQEGL
jgi:hypothetical protein